VRQKGFTPIIILFVVILLGVAGYIGYIKGYFKKIPSETTLTPSPVPISTPDTLNWKTYTNNQYGFSFKYPNDWKFEDRTPRQISGEVNVLAIASNVANSKNGSLFLFNVYKMDKENLEEWVISHSPSGDGIPYFYLLKDWYKKSITNGLESIVTESHYPEGKYAQNISVILSKNKIAYTITMVNPFPEEKMIFDQIVSTFKFTQ